MNVNKLKCHGPAIFMIILVIILLAVVLWRYNKSEIYSYGNKSEIYSYGNKSEIYNGNKSSSDSIKEPFSASDFFFEEPINCISKITEHCNYLIGNGSKLTLYISKNKQTHLMWENKLYSNGPIVDHIQNLAKKYNKKFFILRRDVDLTDIVPNNGELRLTSTINKYSDPNTYPIPHFDEYFKNENHTESKNNPDIVVTISNIPFEDKKDNVVWRGQIMNRVRKDFFKYLTESSIPGNPLIDFKETRRFDKNNKAINSPENKMSIEDQMKYKYIISVDGQGWPGNIVWVLKSGSVPIIGSNHHIWFFDLLEPWVDYVPFKIEGSFIMDTKSKETGYTFPDFHQNLQKIINDQELAKKISYNAPRKIRWILSQQKKYLDLIFKTEMNYPQIIDKIKKDSELNVIIPIRDREDQLTDIIPVLTEVLKYQGIRPRFFVIEQEPEKEFNKAMLLNIGFLESQKENPDNEYYLMNDVDIYPLDPHIFDYSLRKGVYNPYGYDFCLGGFFLIDRDSLKKINGLSNEYWGWGYEDVDIQNRLQALDIPIDRSNFIPRLTSKKVQDDITGGSRKNENKSKNDFSKYKKDINNIYKDGLNTCIYQIKSIKTIPEFNLVRMIVSL
jgi:GT2 family glycosyltransferase